MDIATVIGLILGFGLIIVSIMLGGGGIAPFVDVASIMIVFGGSIAATLINFPLKQAIGHDPGRPEMLPVQTAGPRGHDRRVQGDGHHSKERWLAGTRTTT